MFLGFEDSLKSLKKEWKDAGVNMSFVRDWQKSYDKVIKSSPGIEADYTKAKRELELVHNLLMNLERYLVEGAADKDAIAMMAADLKKYQMNFKLEFLIGKEDSDFHLTYASILKLCGQYAGGQGDLLILQSEVENLLAVVKEALEKNWPNSRALAYFYISHNDSELEDLPHGDKVMKVNRIYESEFIQGLRGCLTGYMSERRIQHIMEEELWR